MMRLRKERCQAGADPIVVVEVIRCGRRCAAAASPRRNQAQRNDDDDDDDDHQMMTPSRAAGTAAFCGP